MPKPVDASSLRKGLEKAKRDIKSMMNETANIMTAQYNIRELELSVSFDAEGKFMGFGVGDATSIKIKIAPIPVTEPQYYLLAPVNNSIEKINVTIL